MGGAAHSRVTSCPLSIVTGAPGAGKSSTVEALIAREPSFLVFDADWLLDATSLLTGQTLTEASSLWPQYRRLWLTIAQIVERNGRSTVLFIPVTPPEIAELLPDPWRGRVRWCLLDCDDQTRRERLQGRDWPQDAIDEAIDDGEALRGAITCTIDTSRRRPDEVAAEICAWSNVSALA